MAFDLGIFACYLQVFELEVRDSIALVSHASCYLIVQLVFAYDVDKYLGINSS